MNSKIDYKNDLNIYDVNDLIKLLFCTPELLKDDSYKVAMDQYDPTNFVSILINKIKSLPNLEHNHFAQKILNQLNNL